MIQVYLDETKKYVGVKVSGPNFDVLREILKENHFSFAADGVKGSCNDKMWVKKVAECADAFEELGKIEPVRVSAEVDALIHPEPETEYLRVKYDESLLTSPPLGEYQKRTIEQAVKQSRCYFAHKQGLGKTFMAFGTLNHLWNKGLVDRCLIVCRPEGAYNLKRELLRFNIFGLTENDIYMVNAENRDPFSSGCKVVISNYRSFLMLCSDEFAKMHKGKKLTAATPVKKPVIDLSNWGSGRCLFVDEAHSCKNRSAGQTRHLILESQFFRFRYMMSGTPYPKGIEDLWSQFQIMDPMLIGKPYNEFISDIANIGTKFSAYAIRSYKTDKIEAFLEKAKPWLIREFSTDNLVLPEQIEKRVYFDMSPKQRKIYQQFISYRMGSIMENNKMKLVMREVYKEFSRIQQAVVDPCIMKGKLGEGCSPELVKMVDSWKFGDNPRVEMCDSIVENALDGGKRIIIWSGHPDTIQRLGEHYSKYKPVLIHGAIPQEPGKSRNEQIDALVEEFKNNDEHKILIASYLMIATSCNIREAGVMIYFDRSWSFVDLDQSKERNHRPGSEFDSIEVYYLIGNKTIEEKQDRVLKKREDLDRELLSIDSLTKEQWRKLFEGEEIEG